MQNAETVLNVLRERGRRGLPCTELYRQLFNPSLYELAHGRVYANHGAMTPGVDGETADGMSLATCSPDGPVTRNRRPASNVAVAAESVYRASSGCSDRYRTAASIDDLMSVMSSPPRRAYLAQRTTPGQH